MLEYFDNIINKDSFTYDFVINELIEHWDMKYDFSTIIFSYNSKSISNIIFDILKHNKHIIKESVNIRVYDGEIIIRSNSKHCDKSININIFQLDDSYTYDRLRGYKANNIIVDVDAIILSKVKYYIPNKFNDEVINHILFPMLTIPSDYKNSFILLY